MTNIKNRFQGKKNRILVLGASGMLGNAVFRYFSQIKDFQVYGTLRSTKTLKFFPDSISESLIAGIDIENTDNLITLFKETSPDIVINCIGVVKQLDEAEDPLKIIPINVLLPHRLARLCELFDARFVHVSTDCVFSGKKGMYTEFDISDANDLYGRSKFLGEVNGPNAITLRTSIIGHELDSDRSLIGWFLSQENYISGYSRAIFSGLPTIEIARIICDYVIPNTELKGLYHVSAEPISKYNLLKLVSLVYEKNIEIIEDKKFVIDRSLDSSRFRKATGFMPKPWHDLITSMRNFG